jgi:Flp pilus assembly pilin Flp
VTVVAEEEAATAVEEARVMAFVAVKTNCN